MKTSRGGADDAARDRSGRRMRVERDTRHAHGDARREPERDAGHAHRRAGANQREEDGDRIDGRRQHRVSAEPGEIPRAHADAPAEERDLGQRDHADRGREHREPAGGALPRIAEHEPDRDRDRERQRESRATERGNRDPQTGGRSNIGRGTNGNGTNA